MDELLCLLTFAHATDCRRGEDQELAGSAREPAQDRWQAPWEHKEGEECSGWSCSHAVMRSCMQDDEDERIHSAQETSRNSSSPRVARQGNKRSFPDSSSTPLRKSQTQASGKGKVCEASHVHGRPPYGTAGHPTIMHACVGCRMTRGRTESESWS